MISMDKAGANKNLETMIEFEKLKIVNYNYNNPNVIEKVELLRREAIASQNPIAIYETYDILGISPEKQILELYEAGRIIAEKLEPKVQAIMSMKKPDVEDEKLARARGFVNALKPYIEDIFNFREYKMNAIKQFHPDKFNFNKTRRLDEGKKPYVKQDISNYTTGQISFLAKKLYDGDKNYISKHGSASGSKPSSE